MRVHGVPGGPIEQGTATLGPAYPASPEGDIARRAVVRSVVIAWDGTDPERQWLVLPAR